MANFLRTNNNPADLVEITAPSAQTDDVVMVLNARNDPAARIEWLIQNVGTKEISIYLGNYDGTTWTMNTSPHAILSPNLLGSLGQQAPCSYHGPVWAGIADESDTDSGWLLVSESY